jgi:hypothetical protein
MSSSSKLITSFVKSDISSPYCSKLGTMKYSSEL